jgi:anti-anti-sigma factor
MRRGATFACRRFPEVYWDVKREGDRTRIAIRGPVDFEEVEDFRTLLQKHVGRQESVLLDLSDCDFLCSMAVGTVLGFKIESRLAGGDLWLVNASDAVRRMFEIVKASELIFE